MLRFRKKKSAKNAEDAGNGGLPQRRGSRETSTKENGGSAQTVATNNATPTPGARPVINVLEPGTMRSLNLRRLSSGGFGFTLRKGYVLDRIRTAGRVETVIFAEPGVGNRLNPTALLPGDRLMEINGIRVHDRSREEIIELIRGSGSELTVGVQTIPELVEINATAADLTSDHQFRAELSDSDSDANSMWLRTDQGYSTVKAVPLSNSVYEVDCGNGQKVQVNQSRLERANPERMNLAQSLCSLTFVNETSFLHTLNCRYANNLIHTNAGPTVLIINPIYPLAIYSEKVSGAIINSQTESMPPHIYSLARKVHEDITFWNRNQSVIFMGHSGSGKTTNVRHFLKQLVTCDDQENLAFSTKLQTAFTVMDCMTYSKSCLNRRSNRSTHLFFLDFDQSGKLCSMSIQLAALGEQCSFRRSVDTSSTDLVSMMLSGLDPNQKADLWLDNAQKTVESRSTPQTWSKLLVCLKAVGFGDRDIKALCYLTAALVHLSSIRLLENQGKGEFMTSDSARKAATLLGLELEDLARFVFDREGTSSLLLEHFINCLYSEIVDVIVNRLNRFLHSDKRVRNFVLIVDPPGFKSSDAEPATFSDLFDNYVQERFRDHYFGSTVGATTSKYAEDGVACDYSSSDKPSVADKMHAVPQMVLTPKMSRKDAEQSQKGLFCLMEEESMLENGSDVGFVEKLCKLSSSGFRKGREGQFVIDHFDGNSEVVYGTEGWIERCKINRNTWNVVGLMQNSCQDFVLKFLQQSDHGVRISGPKLGGLRRATSMRFVPTGSSLSQKAMLFRLRSQTDKIMETVCKTRQHFVHCLLPTPNSGLVDGDAELKSTLATESGSLLDENLMPNIILLRRQIRSFRLVEVVGFWKRFHPEFLRLDEFIRRYGILAPNVESRSSPAEHVHRILDHLAIDPHAYKIGRTNVFMRQLVLEKLDLCRRNRVAATIVHFQSHCRGYLMRRKILKYRSQRLALAVIQKNVRKYVALGHWSWWRLFVKVRPLLSLNSAEFGSDGADGRCSELMIKLREAEIEKNRYKAEVSEHENRLNAVIRELSEEQACSSDLQSQMELEQSRRLQYEKEIESLSAKNSQMAHKIEHMEMNLMQSKIWRSKIEQENSTDSNMPDTYEAAIQELQFVRKQFKADLKEELEKERRKRKNVEGKLSNTLNVLAKEKQSNIELNEKNSRTVAELQDLKVCTEEQKSKIKELLNRQHDESKRFVLEERIAKLESEESRRVNEQEILVAENFSMKQELQDLRDENDRLTSENRRLQMDVQELTDAKGDSGDGKIRREYQSLKIKVADQEDELNELSDEVKLLGASKTRLELQIEAMRKEHIKEMEEKEEEFNLMKSNLQKRCREMEQQLEDEYDTKRSLHREKNELESQMHSILSERQQMVPDDRVKKMRLELRRTKALLRDAHVVLNHQGDEASSKSQIRQLKNALEDAESQANTRTRALRTAQQELLECREELTRMTRNCSEHEDKCSKLTRHNTDLEIKVDDLEEEVADLVKKYRSSVEQLNSRGAENTDMLDELNTLRSDNETLNEELATLKNTLLHLTESTISAEEFAMVNSKLKDAENNHELEKTIRSKLENSVVRLKEQISRLQEEADDFRGREKNLSEEFKRCERRMKEYQDELNDAQYLSQDTQSKYQRLQSDKSLLEDELARAASQLKDANRRIEDLKEELGASLSATYDDSDDSDVDSLASSEFEL